jgi:hypothetical protein
LNISESTSSGSGPTEISNSSNSPGFTVPPVHVIFDAAFEISSSWIFTGVASVVSSSV